MHSSTLVRIPEKLISPVLKTIANLNPFSSGSRYLFALAQNGQAPKALLYCTKTGVPIWCVCITGAVGLLTYMVCSAGSAVVFEWFQTFCSITSLVTWISILIAYLRFKKALDAQGVNRRDLPMRGPAQPYVAWAALSFFSLVLLFNGWTVFTNGGWDTQGFVAG